MIECIKNLIKIGIKRKTLSPRRIEVEFLGKKEPAFLYLPYGMFANIKNDIPTVLMQDQANEESLIAMPTDIDNREELDEDEIGFGVPSLSARVYFRKDGKIYFKIGDTEGGDYAVRFNELKAGFDELKDNYNNLESALSSIVSGASIPEPGNGAPSAFQAALAASFASSAPLPSTASIDDSKIEEIELPEL